MNAKAKARKNRMPSSLMATSFVSDSSVGVFTSDKSDAKQLKTPAQLNQWLSDRPMADRGGLDIRGRVIAELGVFKDRRGEFDRQSLDKIAELGNSESQGLKSNFKHPTMSDDSLGKHLGRDREFYVDEDGSTLKVRSRHFVLSSVAMKSPPEGGGTPYGEYVAELAISDPSAFSSSLVLAYKPEYQTDATGQREREPDGNLKPAIWRPTKLWSIDCVAVGDAVDDFLSMDSVNLDENERVIQQANLLITRFFDMDEITPDVLTARLNGFTKKLVAFHFENEENPEMTNSNSEQSQTPANEAPAIDAKQLLDAQNKTNTLLEKLISGQAANKTDAAAANLSDEPDGAEVAKKIAALCKSQGRSDLIADYLSADPPMTVDGVKDALLKLAAKDRSLDDNSNDDQQSLSNKGTGGKKTPTLDEDLQAEYDANQEYQTLGMSFEDFAIDRKIELGILPETAEIMKGGKSLSAQKSAAAAKTAGVVALLLLAGLVMFLTGTDPLISASLSSFALVPLVGMAVTANQLISVGSPTRKVRRKIAAAVRIYNGTLTFVLPAGHLTNIIAAGANVFGGISCQDYDNSAGAAGAVEGETIIEGLVTLINASHSLTIADVESPIYATDNYTLTTTSTNNTLIGTLKDVDDKGDPVLYIG